MNPAGAARDKREAKPAEAIPVILCADDYGLAPGIGAAIRDLLERGRLSATSCMTVSRFWSEEALALRLFAGKADIGLHLTLTDQRPLGAMPGLAPQGRLPSLRRLFIRAIAGGLDRKELRAELARQLERFEAAFDRPPDFLDGHQHVHQIPLVRDLVIELFQMRLAGRGAYLRYCDEAPAAILRRGCHVGEALSLSLLGRAFAHRARHLGIPGNRHFTGVHDFKSATPYGLLFRRFLSNLEPGTLLMCHPGLSDAALEAADPVTRAREEEYRFFLSDDFTLALAEAKAAPARFAALGPDRHVR